MLTVIQRVNHASVVIKEETTARIQQGLAVLCGFEKKDTPDTLARMLDKCINYRIFSDEQGKMNQSLSTIQGDLLLIPQFTLLADTARGLRPSFSKGAPPAQGKALFAALLQTAKTRYPRIVAGQFGADMQIHLCNDGPVTFMMSF